jgi:hypothetical protein
MPRLASWLCCQATAGFLSAKICLMAFLLVGVDQQV